MRGSIQVLYLEPAKLWMALVLPELQYCYFTYGNSISRGYKEHIAATNRFVYDLRLSEYLPSREATDMLLMEDIMCIRTMQSKV